MSKKKRAPRRAQGAKAQPPACSATFRRLAPGDSSLGDEIDNILRLASQGECRVIGLNQLVFFSTFTGDAWMLDWQDELAICLAKDGVPQHCAFGETDRRFAIQWQGRYHIRSADRLFSYVDNKTPNHMQVIHGYPTEAIEDTVERLACGL